MVSIDYQYAASIGFTIGADRIALLGNNSAVDTATTPEDVWAGAGLGLLNGYDHKLIPFPETAVSMEVASSDTADTALGSGSRKILISYLDANWIAKHFLAVMNGLTPVAMPEPVLRINRIRVTENGTRRGANKGNIFIRDTGGLGKVYGFIPAPASFPSPRGISRAAAYSVPANCAFDLMSFVVSINRANTQESWATFTINTQNENGPAIEGIEVSCSTSAPYRHENGNMPINTIDEKSDIWVTCLQVSNNASNCSAAIIGIERCKKLP